MRKTVMVELYIKKRIQLNLKKKIQPLFFIFISKIYNNCLIVSI